MMQTGSVSRSVAISRPVYGYLNRPVLASTRLCNISLSPPIAPKSLYHAQSDTLRRTTREREMLHNLVEASTGLFRYP
jgi:hypothetical protein